MPYLELLFPGQTNIAKSNIGLPRKQQLQILVYCEFFNPVGKSFLTHHQVMKYIL